MRPLIDARAAPRGRPATTPRDERRDEGGPPLSMTYCRRGMARRMAARGHGAARTAKARGNRAVRVREQWPPLPPATRRSSANAPHRGGGALRKAAMSTPVRNGVIGSSATLANRIERGSLDALAPARPTEARSVGGAVMPEGPDERFASARARLCRPPRCTARRRTRGNARAQRKAAMSAPGVERASWVRAPA
jgi:hypothetical protein